MKLYTFRVENKDRIGVLLRGHLVDLATAYQVMLEIRDKGPGSAGSFPPTMAAFLRAGVKAFEAARETLTFVSKRPAVPVGLRLAYAFDEVNLLAPLRPGKILCCLRKGGEHFFFQKATSAIVGSEAPIEIPRLEGGVESTSCLAAILGKRAKAIREIDAASHIAGYTILNDVSSRNLSDQGHITLGKNFDTFCPLGPCLATPDELAPQAEWRRFLNGRMFDKDSIQVAVSNLVGAIVTLAQVMTLEPGDIVATDLIGAAPIGLTPGDVLALEIDGIGRLENRCAASGQSREGETPVEP